MTEKDNPMVNNLARARARKAGQRWADFDADKADHMAVRDARLEGFEAGAAWAVAPESEAEVNQIVASLIRDAQEAGGDDAADDAAQRIFAYLGAIHREEQDLWAARRQALRDAIRSASLIEDGTGWLKVHGLDNAGPLFDILQAAYVEANAAQNPAEAMRQIAERMVDGEAIKGVDHASFDAAAAYCAEEGQPDEENPEASAEWFAGARWRTDGVADLAAFRITTGDPRFDPAGPVTVNGFLYHPASKEN